MAGAPTGSELLPSFVCPERAGWANSGLGVGADDDDWGASGRTLGATTRADDTRCGAGILASCAGGARVLAAGLIR